MIKGAKSIKERLYNLRKIVKHPEKTICKICKYKSYRYAFLIPDKLHIKCLFKTYMNEKLRLSHPVTFNEKLQWLKLYDRKPEYTQMVDKAEVKQYVTDTLGEDITIPTIGIYESIEKIPFESLPEQFVIKCTHDSGSTFICKEKSCFDTERVKAALSKKLKLNFFWVFREWAYKSVKPQIIVEEYICDENGDIPVDYKFFCFNGRMEYFKIDYNRFIKRAANYYNRACELQPFGKIHSTPDPSIRLVLPEHFEKMVRIAEKLADGIPFLRVDMYCVRNRIYFGELTFFPSSGIEPFIGNGDLIMGDLLKLSTDEKRVK